MGLRTLFQRIYNKKSLVGFKKDDIVFLIEDKWQDEYVIIKKTDELSRGPMRQFSPSPVYEVKDKRGGIWYFREDAIKLKIFSGLRDYRDNTKKVPLHIYTIAKAFPIVDYKKKYGEDINNLANGEITQFNTSEVMNEIGKQVVGSEYDSEGNEYNCIWKCLGNNWFKLISKTLYTGL